MDTPEKAEFAEREVVAPSTHHQGHHGHHGHQRSSMAAEIEKIDAIALAPETTLESFAHLDQKKILRKVWMGVCDGCLL